MGKVADSGRAAWWISPLSELRAALATGEAGLTDAEAGQRIERFGPNRFREHRARPLLLQFLSRFRNPLVIVLLVASGASALTGDATDFFIISVIVLCSITLDFVQEHRANRASERLRHAVAVRATVLRGGRKQEVPLASIVPGDLVLLSAGALVPADGRVVEANDFFVKQPMLTGEPYPVEKRAVDLPATSTDLSAADNAVFMGTSVISGSATVLVCRTGSQTEMGRIASSLEEAAPPTAFEVGTRRFGLLIMRLTVLMVLFVLMVNALFHRPLLESFLFAVALAVGLTPELLPMVVSVTLARGACPCWWRRAVHVSWWSRAHRRTSCVSRRPSNPATPPRRNPWMRRCGNGFRESTKNSGTRVFARLASLGARYPSTIRTP